MYKTVEMFFDEVSPELGGSIGKANQLWLSIKGNTVSNKTLAAMVFAYFAMGEYGQSAPIYHACLMLLSGRMLGLVPNPEVNATT